MIKKILLMCAAVCAMTVSAETVEEVTGYAPNEMFRVKILDLKYEVPQGKPSAGEVVGTVLDAIAGNATNNRHSELAPEVNAKTKAAFTGVRRLTAVMDNPQFTISGDITNISTTISSRSVEEKDSKGRIHKNTVTDYQALVGVTLTLTDVETGQQWTQSFSADNGFFNAGSTETDAVQYALSNLQKDITKYYNSMFPLTANIIEQGDAKKDKQKELYIDLGDAHGAQKGLHLTVYQIGQIGGKETRKQIGKLKIEEVLGDEVSRCKVEKGGKEIKAALDTDQPLLIISID